MRSAFIDTTVLADTLLKIGAIQNRARATLRNFDTRLISGYVIKEFKAGPLSNYIWTHNKLLAAGSVAGLLEAIHRMSMTPRRYKTSTAIEALTAATRTLGSVTTGELVKKYGSRATKESIDFDRTRLALKRIIAKGWKQRRNIATQATNHLTCYTESELSFDSSGKIDQEPLMCRPKFECCLGSELRSRASDVERVERAVPVSGRREDQKRKEALRHVRLRRTVDEKICRALGDALIVLQCPADAEIVTTNGRDHEPLAKALGKKVCVPK
jgi:hypothetical protein